MEESRKRRESFPTFTKYGMATTAKAAVSILKANLRLKGPTIKSIADIFEVVDP